MTPIKTSRHASLVVLILALAGAGISACAPDGPTGASQSRRAVRAHLVETVAVQSRRISHVATRTGTLEARREVKIFNQEEGRITAIGAYEGDRAERGEVLVRMDDALLRAQLDKAAATSAQAQTDRNRLRTLVRKRLAAEDELARAETALKVAHAEEALLRTRLQYTVIRAPFTGTVTLRAAEPGDVVPKYTHILTLIDPRTLMTRVEVSELLLPLLHIGDAVMVRIDALGDGAFPGRIQRIHPIVDPRTRQGVVEIRLAPVPDGARAGQLCRVRLKTPARQRLMLPFAALRRDETGEYVFVVDDAGKARRTAVRTGMRQATAVEILDGVTAGTRVVTRGLLGLEDGMAVRTVAHTGPAGAQAGS